MTPGDHPTSAGVGPIPGTRRILVVDDEPELLGAVCDGLRDAGFDVTGFTNAADALSGFRGGHFDLLLTDLVMPETDGVELFRQAARIDA